jgi:hypothetical protein
MKGRAWRNVLRVAIVAIVAIASWFAVGFSSAQRACAHDPRFACSPRAHSNPVSIADATKSWAFYGHLRSGETDEYDFTLAMAAKIPWSLLVDARDVANPARPVGVLFGPDGKPVRALDFAHAERFYEPFSREEYLTTPPLALALQPGAYHVIVKMQGGTAEQRYVMAIGADERFGVGEIPYVVGAIHRIRALDY